MTTEIVSAYVARHYVQPTDVGSLITAVATKLAALGEEQEPPKEERPKPAVPIKKSITPDYLVCLENGKKLKMLKRHLKTRYDMTPDEYRERWGLSNDYPMVAPRYAELRAETARRIGLGRREPVAPVKRKLSKGTRSAKAK